MRDDPKGTYQHYHIRNTIGEPYGLNKVEMAITSLWETRRGQFLLVCVSNKTESQAINKEGVINNNFVMDVTTGTVREAQFSFDKLYNDYQIDHLYLGPISMFRTFFF